MRLLSYWIFPVISGVVWLGMLLALLLYWIYGTDSEHYPSMNNRSQSIAYISDVGAYELKPLFIAGCTVTAVFLDLSFLSDRWLRHRGRLVPNGSVGEKILMGLTIAFAILGTAGLVLLAVFDTYNHPQLHRLFLLLFIVGYLLSAIFICWEYQRLGIKHRNHRMLRISFWVKLIFVLVEFALALAFMICLLRSIANPAAILEWIVALVFSFYIFSFVIDLYPAVHTKDRAMRYSKNPVGAPTPGTSAEASGASSARDMAEVEEGNAIPLETAATGPDADSQLQVQRQPSVLPPPGQEYPRFMERVEGPPSRNM